LDDVVGGVVLGFGGEAAVGVVLVGAFAAGSEGELGERMKLNLSAFARRNPDNHT
jgi:hypothetical protein